MADPRTSILNERLKGVRRIIAVSGGKGGVGKSLFASTLALVLAKRGFRVGLFDLDFTSPSTHVILGVGDLRPKEEKGIIPPRVHGLEYMSIIYYSGSNAVPLRGADVSNALIELMSIVKWGKLDYLILDMPPGIGDATLDLIRLIERIEFLIVTTPSKLAFETLKKLAGLLRELRIPMIGVVENMKMTRSEVVQQRTKAFGLAFLGEIPYDGKIEEAVGKTDRLLATVFAKKVKLATSKIQDYKVKRVHGK
jgi:ATP-binding protein involved in chromosome partitioning